MIAIPVKIGILFLKKEKEKVLDILQRNGSLHIVEMKEREETKEELIEIETKIARVRFILDFLSLFKKEKKKSLKEKLEETFGASKICLKEKEIMERVSRLNLEKILEKCQEIEATLNQIQKREKEIKKGIEFCREWEEIPYDLKKISEISVLRIFCGWITNINEFEKELKNLTSLYELKILSSPKKQKKKKIFLLYYYSKEKEIRNLLKRFSAVEVGEVKFYSILREELKKLKSELQKDLEMKKTLLKEIEEISQKYEENLKIAFDYFHWKKKKIEAEERSLKRDFSIFVMGWIIKDKLNGLKKELEKVTKNFEIFRMKPQKGEEPPLIIENKEILSPGEVLLDIYGMPRKEEADPVPFITPFFILFFGFCLGDAGYGIIMTLLALFLIKFLKIPSLKKPFYLLLYCGISTTIMGIIFGSFFGLNVESFQLINPLKNPLLGLTIALYLGIFQILFGLGIKMYIKIKNKLTKEAILDELPWIYFIFTILIFTIKDSLHLSPIMGKYLVLSGALSVVITHSRKGRNLFLKPLTGILSLYNLVGYFSDTLSYSRLLALGLSTAVIASVVNLTAQIFQGMIPGVGMVTALLILIVGHLFNFIISSLGAFIHSMRLQFVEFIPKFMEGGGKKFIPFSRESKYVYVK